MRPNRARALATSSAPGLSGITSAVSARSARRVNGKPALPNAARLGMAMKWAKPLTSMVESPSIAADTSGKVFLQASATGRSKKKWKRSWLLAENGPVGNRSGCSIGMRPFGATWCHSCTGSARPRGRPSSGRVATKASLMLTFSAERFAPSGRV